MNLYFAVLDYIKNPSLEELKIGKSMLEPKKPKSSHLNIFGKP